VASAVESLRLVALAKRDWLPGDVIQQGSAILRGVDVIEPGPRDGDGLEVGLLIFAGVSVARPVQPRANVRALNLVVTDRVRRPSRRYSPFRGRYQAGW
jgi:hypothetical protein